MLAREDDFAGAQAAVVISDRLWREWFNGDRAPVGRAMLRINTMSFTSSESRRAGIAAGQPDIQVGGCVVHDRRRPRGGGPDSIAGLLGHLRSSRAGDTPRKRSRRSKRRDERTGCTEPGIDHRPFVSRLIHFSAPPRSPTPASPSSASPAFCSWPLAPTWPTCCSRAVRNAPVKSPCGCPSARAGGGSFDSSCSKAYSSRL